MAEPTSRLDSDAELVRAAQAGCHAAFTELFNRHYPSIRRACLRRLGNSVDAEEVAQATFVRAFERIGQCEGERRFRAWVHVIAHRLCVDTVRARARTQPEEVPVSFEQPGTGADNPEQSVLAQERVRHLREALATLSERQRDAVVARTLEERGPGEIAAALGLSVGAVDSLLLRGRRRLARAYHRMAEERGAAAATVTAVSAAAVASGATARPRRVASAIAQVQHTALQLASTVGLLPATRPPGHGVATAVLTAVLAVQTASGAPPPDAGRAEAFASRSQVILPLRTPVAPMADSVGESAVGGSLTALVGGLLDAARAPARPGRPATLGAEQMPGGAAGPLAAGFEPRSLAELAETVLGPLPSTAAPAGTDGGSRRPLADVILEAIAQGPLPDAALEDPAADAPEPATPTKPPRSKPAPAADRPDAPASDESSSSDDVPAADPPADTAPATPPPPPAPADGGSTTTDPPPAGGGTPSPPTDGATDVLPTVAKDVHPGLKPLLP